MTAETSQAGRPSGSSRVAPLAPIAVAVIAGVVVDRYADPFGTSAWAGLALLAGTAALRIGRWERLQRAAIVALYLAVGGAHHHHRWSNLPPDHLARSIDDESPTRPSWLRGVLVQVPEFRPPEFPDEEGYTRTILDVEGLCDGDAWHPASGRVRLTIGGDRTDLAMGEAVQAAGTLGPIGGPRNPGEADFRAILRGEGIRLRLSADGMSVWRDPEGRSRPWLRALGQAREWSRETLTRAMGPDSGPLAAALVLGRREAVDPDVNDAFARTGTTHLLAISGLHLQVLALVVLLACRLAALGPRWSAGLAGLAVVGYAVLVGPMPSVVRSTTMTAVVCAAVLRSRPTRSGNVLAAAALITIAWNPSDLFDVGCQLSFLAVASILWLLPIVVGLLRHELPRVSIEAQAFVIELRDPNDPLDALERKLAPRWKKGVWQARDWLVAMLVVSAVVWAATAPLVALRFHLIAPIGIPLNVPLIPMTSLALVLAAATLGLSALWPPLGVPTAAVAAALLEGSEWVVRWGASVSWGHVFTPGPSAWWVLGYTVGIAVLAHAAATGRSRRTISVAATALGAWVLGGLGVTWLVPRHAGPEVEVLAVDHGLSVIVRDGGGRTLLYDCGRMRDPRAGRRVIAPALWSKGLSRIDEVVLSHADADHYNGLPDLLERFSIGAIRVPPGFGGPENAEAGAVLAAARARGIPVRTIAAGEPWADEPSGAPGTRRDLRDRLAFSIEHPPRNWLPGAPDNDRSVVLTLSCRGRRLLLTGDLDGAGLVELIARPTPAVDALLAPHHGGRTANPPWFYAWARPGLVLASQATPAFPDRDVLASLDDRCVPVLRTWERGAIRLLWEADEIVATGFLGGRWRAGDAAGAEEAVEEENRGAAAVERTPARKPDRVEAPDRLAPALAWLAVALGLAMGAAAFVALAVVEWGAWTLVRPGRRLSAGDDPWPGPVEPPPWRPISVVAPDGVPLEGAVRPAEGAGAGGRTAILLHGFAEDRTALLDRAEALARHGWEVALLDSRGRGRSRGDWSTFGALEADDLRAWLDALSARAADDGNAPPRFVAWGRSMGAAIALRAAASDTRLDALVLEAPYADLAHSVARWLRRSRLPGWLAGPTLRRARRLTGSVLDRPRPVELARRVGVPVLILHGAEDRITPPPEARRLADAFPTPPIVVEVPGARHVDLFEVAGDALTARVAAFLDTATSSPP